MGMCLSRPEGNYPLVFPNELQSGFQEGGGGNNMDCLHDLDLLKQSVDNSPRAEIEACKHKLNTIVPDRYQMKLENPDGQKLLPVNRPVLNCKGGDGKNISCRWYKMEEKVKAQEEQHETRSEIISSRSADLIWDIALDFDISKELGSSCSEKECFSHETALNNCTEMHSAAVDCEKAREQSGDFDEMSFGYKTGEIFDFFREYSFNDQTAESRRSTQPKLQIYSILDIKKFKSIRLYSRFSKSSRFGSSNSETESPRSKFIAQLMKNLSSRSKPKCSNAENNVCDRKSGYNNDWNNKSQKEHCHDKVEKTRQCLLSMFNVDRSFNIHGNIETLVSTDQYINATPAALDSSKGRSCHVDFRDPVKTLSTEFVVLNFCSTEEDNGSAKIDKATPVMYNEARDLGFPSVQELQGVCRLSRLSMEGEEAAFGSPFSIGGGRRSKELTEFSRSIMSGRVSADAFSDSSSDLFELEFLSNQ